MGVTAPFLDRLRHSISHHTSILPEHITRARNYTIVTTPALVVARIANMAAVATISLFIHKTTLSTLKTTPRKTDETCGKYPTHSSVWGIFANIAVTKELGITIAAFVTEFHFL